MRFSFISKRYMIWLQVKTLFAWIKSLFVWSTIAAIGRSRTVSLTIFMPVIGYLLIFNQELIELLQFSQDTIKSKTNQEFEFDFDLSSTLRFLYVGMTCLAIGSILFNLFCPKPIKTYSNEKAYIEDQLENIDPSVIDEIKLQVASAGANPKVDNDSLNYISEFSPDLIDRNAEAVPQNLNAIGNPAKKHNTWVSEYKTDLIRLFRVHYRQLDYKRKFAVIMTTISFTIGFVFVSIPSVNMFLRVLRIILTG